MDTWHHTSINNLWINLHKTLIHTCSNNFKDRDKWAKCHNSCINNRSIECILNSKGLRNHILSSQTISMLIMAISLSNNIIEARKSLIGYLLKIKKKLWRIKSIQTCLMDQIGKDNIILSSSIKCYHLTVLLVIWLLLSILNQIMKVLIKVVEKQVTTMTILTLEQCLVCQTSTILCPTIVQTPTLVVTIWVHYQQWIILISMINIPRCKTVDRVIMFKILWNKINERTKMNKWKIWNQGPQQEIEGKRKNHWLTRKTLKSDLKKYIV